MKRKAAWARCSSSSTKLAGPTNATSWFASASAPASTTRPGTMTEPPLVDLGAGIFALHDPHRGHERDFNRYYERDHMYAAAMLAPWTIAGQRFVATADLKRLRYPADAPFGPIAQASYLPMYRLLPCK